MVLATILGEFGQVLRDDYTAQHQKLTHVLQVPSGNPHRHNLRVPTLLTACVQAGVP